MVEFLMLAMLTLITIATWAIVTAAILASFAAVMWFVLAAFVIHKNEPSYKSRKVLGAVNNINNVKGRETGWADTAEWVAHAASNREVG